MVEEGKKAPEFSLPSDTGGTFTLESFKGRRLVLFFYPRDNTSGCTTEALEFQERLEKFRALGAEVAGVSKDSLQSHAKYRQKHGFTFPLLSDADCAALKAYGAWGVKKLYGKESEGTIRTTVVISAAGLVEKVFSKVKAAGHAEEVLKYLAAKG